MTGRKAGSPLPTEKERRQFRFWGVVGCIIVPLLLLTAMVSTSPSRKWLDPNTLVRFGPVTDTLTVLVTREQCNDEIMGSTTLLMEAFLGPADLIEFRRQYPREDSLARIANDRLKQK